MGKSLKFFLKRFLLVSGPLLVLLMAGLSLWRYFELQQQLDTSQSQLVKHIAVSAGSLIDGSEVQAIRFSSDSEKPEYLKLKIQLTKIKQQLGLNNTAIRLLRKTTSMTEIILDASDRIVTGASFDLWQEMNTALSANMGTARLFTKEGRHLAAGFAPIRNKYNENVALLMVEVDYSGIFPSLFDVIRVPVLITISVFMGLLLIFGVIFRSLRKEVVTTISSVEKLIAGDSLESLSAELNYLPEFEPVFRNLEEGRRGSVESREEKERVQKQIKDFLKVVNSAAGGDFTVAAVVTADTLGALADSFNLMVSDLSDLIRDVKNAAERVAFSTNGILRNIETMANGAEEQAHQTETISNFAREIAENIENTNRSAQRAAEAARAAKEVAERGSTIVRQAVAGMQNIRTSVREASREVRLLGDTSNRISEITDFISEISSRTNLLALNASIEAARAGAAGRGFTVVADEIRSLAGRTSSSAEEILGLIEEIQSGIQKTIKAIEIGTSETAEGNQLMNSAGKVLREILDSVEISTQAVEDISKAMEEQTRFSNDIAGSMEDIAGIAGQTANSASHSKKAARDLQNLSNSLNQAVEKFKLPE